MERLRGILVNCCRLGLAAYGGQHRPVCAVRAAAQGEAHLCTAVPHGEVQRTQRLALQVVRRHLAQVAHLHHTLSVAHVVDRLLHGGILQRPRGQLTFQSGGIGSGQRQVLEVLQHRRIQVVASLEGHRTHVYIDVIQSHHGGLASPRPQCGVRVGRQVDILAALRGVAHHHQMVVLRVGVHHVRLPHGGVRRLCTPHHQSFAGQESVPARPLAVLQIEVVVLRTRLQQECLVRRLQRLQAVQSRLRQLRRLTESQHVAFEGTVSHWRQSVVIVSAHVHHVP